MDEKQAIDLLWDEWKYRHDLFWKLFFRCAGSVITLWAIPFVKPDIFKPFPLTALILPLLALLLSILSALLLGGEIRRFQMVNEKYNSLRQSYLPHRIPKTGVNRVLALPIGIALVWFYGVAFTLTSLVVGMLLLKYF
jgi:hypothetical protein